MRRISVMMLMVCALLMFAACADSAENNVPEKNISQTAAALSDGLTAESGSDTANSADTTDDTEKAAAPDGKTEEESGSEDGIMISVTVGDKAFSAKLLDNDTTRALIELFPLSLDMSELNGNEKYFYFEEGFPADSQAVGNINAGDLMLYGSDCLVLFYEGLPNSYSYTRLGYIEDAAGLAEASGSGSVRVTFAGGLQNKEEIPQ